MIYVLLEWVAGIILVLVTYSLVYAIHRETRDYVPRKEDDDGHPRGGDHREGEGSMSKKTIYDMSPRDLEDALIGKSIVAAEEGEIVLSDGTVLEIEDTADCCAYFYGQVRAIDLSDNVVTGVRVIDTGNENGYLEKYTLTILSSVVELAAVDIEGTAGNGYYVHSVNLNIITKEEK